MGKLVLFPSYFWHGTVPFTSENTRLTIAFDVVPGSLKRPRAQSGYLNFIRISRNIAQHHERQAKIRKPYRRWTALSFEAALKELEGIVARLEQGEVDLEDSIALYERGQALKAHCEKKLKAAEGRLEKIVLGASGPAGTEPMDAG